MTTLTAADLARLLAALRHHLATAPARDAAIAAERTVVARALDRLTGTVAPQPATGHALTRHLPAALALVAATSPALAAVLDDVAARLPWRYGYAARADAPGLETTMGWAEIVGPLAPFVSDEVCLGLTLIGPQAHYLAHRHPAVELYDVVAGHPHWTVAGHDRRLLPGDAVLHPSQAVHAMRTGDEPLLAVYSWTGDVVSPSVWAQDG